jgi:hypothetical protein
MTIINLHFIRLLGQKNCLYSVWRCRYPFKKNLNDFRNKSIFEYEPNNIEKIEYKAEWKTRNIHKNS